MSVTVKTGPSVTQGTSAIIPNASPFNAGVMSIEMVKQLNALSSASLTTSLAQWTSGARFNAGHCATRRVLLPNGNVFVASGSLNKFFGSPTVKCEVYNPTTNTTSRVADFPGVPRSGIGAELLPNGEVLVFGGALNPNGNNLQMFNDCWIWTPSSNTWRATGNLPLYANPIHSAVLPNGKVIACSEVASPTPAWSFPLPASNKTFIFDPAGAGSWTTVADIPQGVIIAAYGMLPDGRFYMAGGRKFGASYAEMDNHLQLYSYLTDTWASYVMPTIVGETDTNPGERGDCAASVLPNGNLLITGGIYIDAGFVKVRTSTVIFVPGSNTFLNNRGPLANSNNVPMISARCEHSSLRLPDGTILLVCGEDINFSDFALCEYYDYVADLFSAAPSAPSTMFQNGTLLTKYASFELASYSCALLLLNGNVLFYPMQLSGTAGGENKDCFIFTSGLLNVQNPPPAITFNSVLAAANLAAIPPAV